MNDSEYLIADFLDYSERLMINHPIQGLIPFRIWDHQTDVARKLLKSKDLISVTARQMGMTTLMITLAHWYAHTFPNSVICYTGDKQTMLNVCREFFKQLDYDIKYTVCNVDKIELSNGSKVLFKSAKFENFCSYTFDMLFIDNAAWISGAGGWWSNLKKSVIEDGYIWVNSTPTDKSTWFYQWYVNAKSRNKIRIPWDKRPDRSKTWYEDHKILTFGLNNYSAAIKNELDAKFV